jgi:hypothetical protein
MLPFGVTIPASVPQRSEIPERLTNYPVYVHSAATTIPHSNEPSLLHNHSRLRSMGCAYKHTYQYRSQRDLARMKCAMYPVSGYIVVPAMKCLLWFSCILIGAFCWFLTVLSLQIKHGIPTLSLTNCNNTKWKYKCERVICSGAGVHLSKVKIFCSEILNRQIRINQNDIFFFTLWAAIKLLCYVVIVVSYFQVTDTIIQICA